MARLSEEERKIILGANYVPQNPNDPSERSALRKFLDTLAAMFGRKGKRAAS